MLCRAGPACGGSAVALRQQQQAFWRPPAAPPTAPATSNPLLPARHHHHSHHQPPAAWTCSSTTTTTTTTAAATSTAATDRQRSHAAASSSVRSPPPPAPAAAEPWDSWDALLAAVALSLPAGAASAVEGVAYNADGGEFFKNVAGVAYVGLLGWFLLRLLKRRAKKAREERVAGTPAEAGTLPPSIFDKLREKLGANDPKAARPVGPGDAFLGALQAGGLAFGLYVFTVKMDAAVGGSGLPDGYTARNISITVRTILLGLGWLFTFFFAANAVGLAGLTVQWLLFPKSIQDMEEAEAARRAAAEAAGPQLPKISVTSKPDELRRTFEEAERSSMAAPAQDSQEGVGARINFAERSGMAAPAQGTQEGVGARINFAERDGRAGEL